MWQELLTLCPPHEHPALPLGNYDLETSCRLRLLAWKLRNSTALLELTQKEQVRVLGKFARPKRPLKEIVDMWETWDSTHLEAACCLIKKKINSGASDLVTARHCTRLDVPILDWDIERSLVGARKLAEIYRLMSRLSGAQAYTLAKIMTKAKPCGVDGNSILVQVHRLLKSRLNYRFVRVDECLCYAKCSGYLKTACLDVPVLMCSFCGLSPWTPGPSRIKQVLSPWKTEVTCSLDSTATMRKQRLLFCDWSEDGKKWRYVNLFHTGETSCTGTCGGDRTCYTRIVKPLPVSDYRCRTCMENNSQAIPFKKSRISTCIDTLDPNPCGGCMIAAKCWHWEKEAIRLLRCSSTVPKHLLAKYIYIIQIRKKAAPV